MSFYALVNALTLVSLVVSSHAAGIAPAKYSRMPPGGPEPLSQTLATETSDAPTLPTLISTESIGDAWSASTFGESDTSTYDSSYTYSALSTDILGGTRLQHLPRGVPSQLLPADQTLAATALIFMRKQCHPSCPS
jgi:hypothetical protein